MAAALVNTFNSIASVVAAIVLNALWEGGIIVVAVWLFVRTWPQLNAATRYAIWSGTLAAVVIVPIATTLPFFSVSATPAATSTSAATTSSSRETSARAQRVVRAPQVTHALTTGSAPASLPPRFRVTFPLPLAIAVFAAWIVLALVALVRLTIGLIRLEQLKRDALPLPVEYRDAMERWTGANKGSREVRLCVSDETDVPVAVGLFDAMILIPRSLLERLSPTEVDQISLHELAHLRRGDDWTNGFQRVALALLAWNPAALFVSQQLDLEREVACDDWVLSLTGTVRPYALCLTKMAETSTWPRQPMPAPGVFATRKHISLRIERLLGAGRNIATTLALGPTAIALAVVTTLSLAIAAVAPSVAAPCLQALAIPQPPAIAAIPAPKIERIIVYRNVSPLPSMPALPETPAHLHVPPVHAAVAPVHVNAPAANVHVPEINVKVPGVNVHVPAIDVPLPNVRGIVAQNVKQCQSCNFSGVNWNGRDMRGSQLSGADLSHASLQNVDFSDSQLNDVDFSGANLQGAKLRNVRLSGCDFSHASLRNVDFTGARISGCDFTGSNIGPADLRTVLNACSGCDFSHTVLSGVDMSNVKTSGNDFSGSNLSGANLSGSVFNGVDFSNAVLSGARLDGATFEGCDFSGVDFSRVNMSNVKVIGGDFSVSHKETPRPH